MKHGEKITFEFVEGGDCQDCCFDHIDQCLIKDLNDLSCTGGHFIKSATTGPHLHTRFGTDPETMKKIQHIADWYNGFDVPEYEFSDGGEPYGKANLIGYDRGLWLSDDEGITWGSDCEIKPFDTLLGKITDEMCRIGNPMGGRLWVVSDRFGVLNKPAELLAIKLDVAVCLPDFLDVRYGGFEASGIRLAKPEELQSNNIDPREAGVKDYMETV